MKQKDIALIAVIAVISAVVAYFVSNKLFVTPANRQQQVEVVDSINATFPTADSRYFNSDSIDSAHPVQIGGTSNSNPFNGAGQ